MKWTLWWTEGWKPKHLDKWCGKWTGWRLDGKSFQGATHVTKVYPARLQLPSWAVGDISVVTLIRTDTTLDHSQRPRKYGMKGWRVGRGQCHSSNFTLKCEQGVYCPSFVLCLGCSNVMSLQKGVEEQPCEPSRLANRQIKTSVLPAKSFTDLCWEYLWWVCWHLFPTQGLSQKWHLEAMGAVIPLAPTGCTRIQFQASTVPRNRKDWAWTSSSSWWITLLTPLHMFQTWSPANHLIAQLSNDLECISHVPSKEPSFFNHNNLWQLSSRTTSDQNGCLNRPTLTTLHELHVILATHRHKGQRPKSTKQQPDAISKNSFRWKD